MAELDADDFFALVDELLTPALNALGFHDLVPYVNDDPASRSRTAAGGEAEGEPVLSYDYWFEAGSQGARAAVDPEDPENADEIRLSYEPASRTLDVRDLGVIAEGRVDWDLANDVGPCSTDEVRRRLGEVARAVLDVVSEQQH